VLRAGNANQMSYIRVVRHRMLMLPSFSSGVRAAAAVATPHVENRTGG
jgi:hypothetical protein